ncbi:MAG: hypothetical protein AAF446_00355, partial [Pseudomonadota bacterium]
MKTLLTGVVIVTLALLLNGCGSREVRSVPPGLSLESVTIVDRQVRVNLLVENRNDHLIMLQSADLIMRLGETVLFENASPRTLEIDPRGRESLQMMLNVNFDGLDQLQRIETSQAYELEGKLQFENLRDYPLRLRGFLHPVPGQPGRF